MPSYEQGQNDGGASTLNKQIKIHASGGYAFTSKKIYFSMFSMSGLRVRVGFGFRFDAFPGATLRGEDRMDELGEGDENKPAL